MKRSIVLVLVLVIFLAACGSPQAQKTEEANPVVILDNEDVTFTIKSVEGNAISIFCENKTDKTVLFTWEDASINGYMIDVMFSEKLLPGTKANSTGYIYEGGLTENGIKEIESITFKLLVMPEDGQDSYDIEAAFVNETFTYSK